MIRCIIKPNKERPLTERERRKLSDDLKIMIMAYSVDFVIVVNEEEVK
jgi:hypothetical protein